MTAGEFMDIAIGVFFLLVGAGLGWAFFRLANVFSQLTTTIHDVSQPAVSILTRFQTTVDEINSELGKIEEITGNVVGVTETIEHTAAALGSAVSTPIKKFGALSAGVSESVSTFLKRRRKEA